MVDAGIARKVDFGEGRFRFEHSYRQPRHFHLICKSCHRSFEFLSSDIEVLVEEVATARGFTTSQSVVQIYGTCEECRTGRAATGSDGHTDLVFARDALRIAIATERSGLEFYTRAARVTRDARGAQGVPASRARGEGAPRQARGALRRAAAARPAARGAAHVPLLQGGGQRHLFRGHRAALRPATTSRRCSSASSASAARTASSRSTASSSRSRRARPIFLEFADEEREHLELLIREYRALVKRQGRAAAAAPGAALVAARRRAVIDLHLHTTASDGRLTPRELVDLAAAAGLRVMAVPITTPRRRWPTCRRTRASEGLEAVAGIEITRGDGRPRRPHARLLHRHRRRAFQRFLAAQRASRDRAARSDRRAPGRAGRAGANSRRRWRWRAGSRACRSDGRRRRARWWPRATPGPCARRSTAGSAATGRRSCRASGRRRKRSWRSCTPPAGSSRWRIRAGRGSTSASRPLREAGLDAIEVYHSDHDAAAVDKYAAIARDLDLLVTGGSDFHDPASALRPGAVTLPDGALAAAAGAPAAQL